jgi:hypothetical protein
MRAPEWNTFCRGQKGLTINADDVQVAFENGRQQTVRVQDRGDTLELSTVVARRGVVESVPDVALRAWVRNRATRLVGFRIDEKGRLVGEAWLPKAGIRNWEFLLVLHRLAAESDRMEYLLTGKDVE